MFRCFLSPSVSDLSANASVCRHHRYVPRCRAKNSRSSRRRKCCTFKMIGLSLARLGSPPQDNPIYQDSHNSIYQESNLRGGVARKRAQKARQRNIFFENSYPYFVSQLGLRMKNRRRWQIGPWRRDQPFLRGFAIPPFLSILTSPPTVGV